MRASERTTRGREQLGGAAARAQGDVGARLGARPSGAGSTRYVPSSRPTHSQVSSVPARRVVTRISSVTRKQESSPMPNCPRKLSRASPRASRLVEAPIVARTSRMPRLVEADAAVVDVEQPVGGDVGRA